MQSVIYGGHILHPAWSIKPLMVGQNSLMAEKESYYMYLKW